MSRGRSGKLRSAAWLTWSLSTCRCAMATSRCGGRRGCAPRAHRADRAGDEPVGFRALDFSSSTAMGVSVRTHREEPVGPAPARPRGDAGHAGCSSSGPGSVNLVEKAHPEVMELLCLSLVNNGMDRFVVLDPTHDMDAVRETARIIKKAGAPRSSPRSPMRSRPCTTDA